MLESKTIITFSAFGLVWQSDFPCQGVKKLANDVPADIKISTGSTPSTLGDNAFVGEKFEAIPGKLLLKTFLIADYLVSDGCHIQINPKANSTHAAIQNLLFGWASAGLLQQRRTLSLHGSAVAHADSAIAFCGDSGVGKSTLVGILSNRGLPVIDDNMLALSINEQKTWVNEGTGYIRLMEDALIKMGHDVSGLQRIDFMNSGCGKYMLPLRQDQRSDKPVTLKRVYILKRGGRLCLRPMLAREKVEALRENIFMLRFAKGLATMGELYERLLVLSSQTDVIELTVPHERGAEFLADEVCRHLSFK